MSEMITKNHALVAQFGDTLDRLLDGIENFVANSRPTLGGERFLTDREVSERLKVSRRTLQDYRNNGVVSYYQLGGKILYKESDIERMLAANGFQPVGDFLGAVLAHQGNGGNEERRDLAHVHAFQFRTHKYPLIETRCSSTGKVRLAPRKTMPLQA